MDSSSPGKWSKNTRAIHSLSHHTIVRIAQAHSSPIFRASKHPPLRASTRSPNPQPNTGWLISTMIEKASGTPRESQTDNNAPLIHSPALGCNRSEGTGFPGGPPVCVYIWPDRFKFSPTIQPRGSIAHTIGTNDSVILLSLGCTFSTFSAPFDLNIRVECAVKTSSVDSNAG